jgi:hypothetical protein
MYHLTYDTPSFHLFTPENSFKFSKPQWEYTYLSQALCEYL